MGMSCDIPWLFCCSQFALFFCVVCDCLFVYRILPGSFAWGVGCFGRFLLVCLGGLGIRIFLRTNVEVDIGHFTMLLFVTSQIVDLYSECCWTLAERSQQVVSLSKVSLRTLV